MRNKGYTKILHSLGQFWHRYYILGCNIYDFGSLWWNLSVIFSIVEFHYYIAKIIGGARAPSAPMVPTPMLVERRACLSNFKSLYFSSQLLGFPVSF